MSHRLDFVIRREIGRMDDEEEDRSEAASEDISGSDRADEDDEEAEDDGDVVAEDADDDEYEEDVAEDDEDEVAAEDEEEAVDPRVAEVARKVRDAKNGNVQYFVDNCQKRFKLFPKLMILFTATHLGEAKTVAPTKNSEISGTMRLADRSVVVYGVKKSRKSPILCNQSELEKLQQCMVFASFARSTWNAYRELPEITLAELYIRCDDDIRAMQYGI